MFVDSTAIQCTIRKAQSSDVPRILELFEELDEVHREKHPELFSAGFIRDSASLEKALQDPNIGFLVAEGRGAPPAIAGFVEVVESQTPEGRILAPRRFGLVDGLVVTKASRRNGVATALLRAAEDWATARGLDALEVTVWDFNDPGHALYRTHGFTPLRQYLRKALVR